MNLNLIPCPNRVLDIGANVGHFAALCKQQWHNIYVHSIETNECCEADLKFRCDSYNITLLGNSIKKIDYYVDRNNPYGQGNSIYKEIVYDQYDAVEKQMVTLDSIINQQFDFIKIDTQGSELDIINGGIQTIKQAKHVLLELSVLPYNHGAPLYPDVVCRMMQLGFIPYYTLNLCYIKEKLTQTDLLFFNTSI